jgi:nicotinamidase-related amidase
MIEPRNRYRNPALLVVDMQNDFVRVGAALEVPDARATIAANQALIDFFRSRKLPVVFTRFIMFPSEVLLWEWSPQASAADQVLLEGAQAPLSGHRP